MYHPFRDTSISDAERAKLGEVWLSYYFTTISDLDDVTPELLASRTALHEGIASQQGTLDVGKTPTLLKMSVDDIEAVKDFEALVGSGLRILRITPGVFARNFENALFDTGGELPRARVVVGWCNESFGDAVWAAKIIHERMKAEQPVEKHRREIVLYCLKGCNHLVGIRV